MKAARRVILTRPEYHAPVLMRKQSSGDSAASHTHAHTHATAHTHARTAEHTTTTNVVSVVCEAARAARTQAHACAREADLDKLLEQISKLPIVEQRQLLDRAAAVQLLNDSKPAARELSMWAAAVYDAFCKAVGGSGAAGTGPLVFRKLLAASSSWQAVERFMSVSSLDQLTVTERQAVYVMLADLLVKHARGVSRHTEAPFSAKLVATCAINVAGLFDAAFPGYAEAGLVHFVARQVSVPKDLLIEH